MASQALLLSSDPHSSAIMRRVLEEFQMKTDLCLSTRTAKRLLKEQVYDSVIIDCDSVDDGLSVIHDMRENRENRNAMTVTLLRDAKHMRAATEMGAHFMLHKPIPAEDARRIIRISRHLISRDLVRQYMRLPLTQLAYALIDEGKQIIVENISEGGMAVQAEEQLANGSLRSVRFTLPNNQTISGEAEVVWSDAAGRAGLKFTAISNEDVAKLSRWIGETWAAGQPDVDGNRSIVLGLPAQMRYARPRAAQWVAMAAAVGIDLALSLLATAIFMLMAWVFSGQAISGMNAVLIGLFFCASYHYLFVVHRRRTFGASIMSRWAPTLH
jgi:ActR/RegA family two-component response regulator